MRIIRKPVLFEMYCLLCRKVDRREQTFPSPNLTTQAAYTNIVAKKSMFIDEFHVKPGSRYPRA